MKDTTPKLPSLTPKDVGGGGFESTTPSAPPQDGPATTSAAPTLPPPDNPATKPPPVLLLSEQPNVKPAAHAPGGPGDLMPIQSSHLGVTRSQVAPQLPALTMANVKYISLSTPLAFPRKYNPAAKGDDGGKQRPNTSVRLPLKQHVLHNLPARATLHREKQITGRFFPKPSYTDSQKVRLDRLHPTPRARLTKRFMAPPTTGRPGGITGGIVSLGGAHGEGSFLVHTPSGIRQKTNMEKSSWVASRIFTRGGTLGPRYGDVVREKRDAELYGDTRGEGEGRSHQSSIPPSKSFYQGSRPDEPKNSKSGLVTGKRKEIHHRADLELSELSPQQAGMGMMAKV